MSLSCISLRHPTATTTLSSSSSSRVPQKKKFHIDEARVSNKNFKQQKGFSSIFCCLTTVVRACVCVSVRMSVFVRALIVQKAAEIKQNSEQAKVAQRKHNTLKSADSCADSPALSLSSNSHSLLAYALTLTHSLSLSELHPAAVAVLLSCSAVRVEIFKLLPRPTRPFELRKRQPSALVFVYLRLCVCVCV